MGTTTAPAPGLAAAILAVMGEVPYALKTGRVSSAGANYTFAGEVDLLRVLRPAMVRHGLCMLPVASDLHEHHETVPGRENKPRISHTVRVVQTYRLLHVSGEGMDLQVVGEGQDSGDKAAAKAMTIALKYALRQAFLIETGDDPDRERPEKPPETSAARERPDERLFREQRADAVAVLRDLGARSQEQANRLIQEATEGAMSLHSLDENPGEVLATMREWRDLRAAADQQEGSQ